MLNDLQEAMIKIHVAYVGDDPQQLHKLWDIKLNTGELLYPVDVRQGSKGANQRRMCAKRSKAKGSRGGWVVPQFSPAMNAMLEQTSHIKCLYQRANYAAEPPVEPTNHHPDTMAKKSANKDKKKDDETYASFTNPSDDADDVEDLASQLNTKALVTKSSRSIQFLEDIPNVKLKLGVQRSMGNLILALGKRHESDGTKLYQTLNFYLGLLHPQDEAYVKLTLSGYSVLKGALTCLDLQLPDVSFAFKEMCGDVCESIVDDEKTFNAGNSDVNNDKIETCGATRKEGLQDAIAQSYKDNDVSGTVKTITKRLLLPEVNGVQSTTVLNTWQATAYDKAIKDGSIKLTKHLGCADQLDIDGATKYQNTYSHWLHAEIPIVTSISKTFTSPKKKAPTNATAKKTAALNRKNTRTGTRTGPDTSQSNLAAVTKLQGFIRGRLARNHINTMSNTADSNVASTENDGGAFVDGEEGLSVNTNVDENAATSGFGGLVDTLVSAVSPTVQAVATFFEGPSQEEPEVNLVVAIAKLQGVVRGRLVRKRVNAMRNTAHTSHSAAEEEKEEDVVDGIVASTENDGGAFVDGDKTIDSYISEAQSSMPIQGLESLGLSVNTNVDENAATSGFGGLVNTFISAVSPTVQAMATVFEGPSQEETEVKRYPSRNQGKEKPKYKF